MTAFEEDFDPFDIGGTAAGGNNNDRDHHHRRHRQQQQQQQPRTNSRQGGRSPTTTTTTRPGRRHQTPPPPRSTNNTPPTSSSSSFGRSRKSRSLTPPRNSSGRAGSSTAASSSASRWKSPFGGGLGGSSSNNNNGGGGGSGTYRDTSRKSNKSSTNNGTTTPSKLSSYVGMGTACLLPEELKFSTPAIVGVGAGGLLAGIPSSGQRKLQEDEAPATSGLAAELVCDGQMFVSGISLDPGLMESLQLDDDDDDYENEKDGGFGRGAAGDQQELGFEVSFSDLINNKDSSSTSSRTFSPRMVHSQNPFTNAVRPFHNCLPISSGYLHDELLEHDYAFRHATMSCGQCWQSVVSQHVRMPTLWWWTRSSALDDEDFDQQQPGKRLEQQQQQEYGRPPLGSPEPFDCPWMYMVNNTIRGHPLLIRQVPNVRSPGVILLHLVVRSYKTVESYRGHHHQNSVFCELEDVVVGCYHPTHHRTTSLIKSATGGHNSYDVDEKIRHVWISHRSRSAGNETAAHGNSSLLYMYLQQQQTAPDNNNNNSMYTNPFMVHTSSSNHHDPKSHRMNAQQSSRHSNYNNNNNHDKAVNNDNLRYVFGDRPPLSTIMVTEQDILHVLDESQRRHVPASVMLLQKYLWTLNKANTKTAKTANPLSSSTTTGGSSSTKDSRTGWL